MGGFLRSTGAKFTAFFSGPLGVVLTAWGFWSGGKAAPLWAGTACIGFSIVIAIYQTFSEKERLIGEVTDKLLTQRREFQDVIDGLKNGMRRHDELYSADRTHYENELTLLKQAVSVPVVVLTRVPDSTRANAEVFAVLNRSSVEASRISIDEIRIPIPERVRREWQEMRDAYQAAIPEHHEPLATEWHIVFKPVKDLVPGSDATLEYRIEGGGPLMKIEDYLGEADSLIRDHYIAVLPIIIEYANSDQTRRWRRPYEFHYVITGRRSWLVSKPIEEISAT